MGNEIFLLESSNETHSVGKRGCTDANVHLRVALKLLRLTPKMRAVISCLPLLHEHPILYASQINMNSSCESTSNSRQALGSPSMKCTHQSSAGEIEMLYVESKEGKVIMDVPYTSTEMLTPKTMCEPYSAQLQLAS